MLADLRNSPPAVRPQERSGGEWKSWRDGQVTVLLVTDSAAWEDQIASWLHAEGYAVLVDDLRGPEQSTEGGAGATEPTVSFDIAVVDMGLTARPAAEVLARLRAHSAAPILAVSPVAFRAPVALDVYEAGADQLVTQAVGQRELVARVRALLRRWPGRPRPDQEPAAGLGPISVDIATCTLTIGDHSTGLTPDECAVLLALLRRPGSVVHREELAAGEAGVRERVLDSVVRQVRGKLEAVEGRRRIETVRGVGFRLLPEPGPAPGAGP
ncbi:MAG: response regulator transcription factor [Acidimicrobiales bacterium]|nr:response regulator transcription factor [Acidimicrobiales bacterium]